MLNRRSFVFSMLAFLGAEFFGLQSCKRHKEENSGGGGRVIMPRREVLSSLDWSSFLRKWSDDILALLQSDVFLQASPLRKEVIKTGYLGFQAASEEEIDGTEKRMGLNLPPSYKKFLRVSNGWRQIAMDAEDGSLYPVSQIGWFKDMHPQSLNNWLSGSGGLDVSDQQYFIYGDRQDPVHLRDRYLKETLAISTEIDSAIYLLNPNVMDANGEWEAWLFGNKLPGANRYQSFQEMMQAEYKNMLRNLKNEIEFRRNFKTK